MIIFQTEISTKPVILCRDQLSDQDVSNDGNQHIKRDCDPDQTFDSISEIP